MLYEAFYPADKLGNKPSKIFYGFVEDNSLITLVVFDSQATSTSVLSLAPENQAKLVYRLLKNHMYGIQVDSIKVVFLRVDSPHKFQGEKFLIQLHPHYVEERLSNILEQREAHLGIFGQLFKNKFTLPSFGSVGINRKGVVIGLTENIHLEKKITLDDGQVRDILQALKQTDYGDFQEILK